MADKENNKPKKAQKKDRKMSAATMNKTGKALQKSEEKYRTLFDSIDQGCCIIEVIFDDDGKAEDYRFLEVNSAFKEQTGLKDAEGKRMRELAPEHEEYWFERYGKVVKTGEPISFQSAAKHLGEYGSYYDVYAFPIDEPKKRRVAILFNDVTERKEREGRQTFLLELSDALRAESNADEMEKRALEMLYEQMELDRCYIASYRLDEDRADIIHQVGNDRVPEMPDMIRLSDFPAAFQQVFNRTLVIDDVAEAEELSDDDRRNISALGLGSLVAATLREGEDSPLWVIVAVSAESREWSRSEIALIEEATERVWQAKEHARSEEKLAASEEKYRTLFNSLDEGVSTFEVVFDENAEPVDLIFLENNPSFTEVTGLNADVIGKRTSEVVPNLEQVWIETYGRVAKTGVSERFQSSNVDTDGNWYDVYASRVGGADSRKVVIVYNNITERKRREQRQEFLLEFSDALRAQPDVQSIKERALKMLYEYLDLDRCWISEVFEQEGISTVGPEHIRPDLSPMSGEFELSEYPETMRQLATDRMIVSDATGDSRFSDSEKELLAGLHLRALLVVPLREGQDDVVWALAATKATPYEWTDGEQALIEDAAERTWAMVERAQAEEKVRENEERLTNAIEAANYGTWELDVESGEFVNRSLRHDQIFGYDEKQETWNIQNILAHIYLDDKTNFIEAVKCAKKSGTLEFEGRIQRTDKGIRWIYAKGTVISTNEEGQPLKMAGVAADITEQKRRETLETEQNRLLKSVANDKPLEETLNYLCEAVPTLNPGVRASVLIADEKGESFEAPIAPDMLPSWSERLDGAPINEMMIGTCGEAVFIGQSICCANVKEDERWSDEWRELCLANGVLAEYSEPIITQGDEVRGSFMLCFSEPRSPSEWEHQLLKFGAQIAGIALERNREKRAQEEYSERLEERVLQRTESLRKNHRKLRSLITELNKAEENERERVAAELHDNLGQILAVTKLKLDFLEKREKNSEITEASEMVDDAINYTRELMSSLKPPERFDEEDVKKAVKWIGVQMKKYELTIDIEDDGQPKSVSDEARSVVLRAVRELLFNVVKHSGKKKAFVQLSRKDGHLEVVVKDHGRGFDKENKKKDDSRESGFGLLNISERLNVLEGNLNIATKPGKGTRAVITVPLQEDREATVADGEFEEGRQLETMFRKKGRKQVIEVLLVDDHDITREGLNKIVEDEHDFELLGEARNGREAVELARELRPDVIVMDINMPEMNGIEATKRIKNEWPDIRIIGLSFHDDGDLADEMRKAGASVFITKAKASDKLCEAIRKR